MVRLTRRFKLGVSGQTFALALTAASAFAYGAASPARADAGDVIHHYPPPAIADASDIIHHYPPPAIADASDIIRAWLSGVPIACVMQAGGKDRGAPATQHEVTPHGCVLSRIEYHKTSCF